MIIFPSLELPLPWQMLRLEIRWFIDVYERKKDMNSSLLELAKLDFNIVQSTHQEDLKYVSRGGEETLTLEKSWTLQGIDELELFTDAVERWDMNAMDQLPDYMKM
ncbi:hypothetical protein TIFTF001_039340 [Ficus carica]|uniref:Terpene synthase metal-binding domain-containing protein n=1 Tax=Ficus carica TaxID=3494 RepID=A0AA88E8X4_FICCA|nr:hypothetical protein TIFTF001_039328 [Ficus carica]GMN70285.1 hypothetical protein TIFTF001_039330 [Ficus carica]GMN70294.1 hypothetical protein TIFTF001_039338 [Ficus carica]GMN70295.1 hypothetical protein TIFTF001_039340 [Ficus carica]